MPTETDALTPTIKFDNAPLPQDWLSALIELRVDRAFQVPARCTLRFFDPGYKLLKQNKVKLGSAVAVGIPRQGSIALVEVTGFSVEQTPGSPPELVVICHDKSHRLGRATQVATYTNLTYSGIVEQLASTAGLSADVTSTSRKLEYVLQVESNLALITELANRVGYDWWVEDSKLCFKPPAANPSPVTLRFEDDLLSFSVKATGLRPDSFRVVGWDSHKQAVVDSQPVNASTASAKPSSTFADLVKTPSSAFGGSAELVSAGIAAATMEEAGELSKALMNRSVATSVTAKGVAKGNGKLKPGATVSITGFGPLDGSYHVTQVEHVYRPKIGLQSRFTAGDRTPTSLVDTLNGNGSKPILGTIGHSGLVVGEVTSINDPDERGRVKVRFSGLSSQEESAWCRLVAVGGGTKRGMVFIPEVGDEVLVGFENGDVRQPVVIGGLYGEKSAIPKWDVADGKVSARRITSRRGHYIELADGDQPDKQHILVMLDNGTHRMRLGADRFDLELAQGKPMSIKIGDSSIVIADNGDMTLESAGNITLKAKLKVAIEASSVDIQGKSQINIAAKGKTAISGAQVAVDGQAQVAIKGGVVQIN
jgi:phage protein D/phage baseplate assembly protein gpV